MGKTRDLFKKITDIKGIFHAYMGTIKDRNVWTKQKQKILRRTSKNSQKNQKKLKIKKKQLNDPDYQNGVITQYGSKFAKLSSGCRTGKGQF